MKKTKTKRKASAVKENDWTEPKYLSKKDREDLKTIKRLYEMGKFKEALKFASDLDTAVREEIPLALWKKIGGELTPSGEAELRAEKTGKSKAIDYSDELSALKELHEDNIGRKFTDEQFNKIFETALKTQADLYEHATEFTDNMMGLLMTLDDATNEWQAKLPNKKSLNNPFSEIQKIISDLRKVIDFYANNKNANWSTVGTLANIHGELGESLYENYDKHTGYSKSVEEGIKRHSTAAKNLLEQASEEVENMDAEKHLPDLLRWKKFFEELLEGFPWAIMQIRDKESSETEHTSSPNSLREEAIELAKKLGDDELEKYLETASLKSIQRRIQALREEVELVINQKGRNESLKKIFVKGNVFKNHNDKKIMIDDLRGKFVLTSHYDSKGKFAGNHRDDAKFISQGLEMKGYRFIGKKLSKPEQKKFTEIYKYVSDNPEMIKPGAKVLDETGVERIIIVASDKTLKLQGDRDWIGINEVKFPS